MSNVFRVGTLGTDTPTNVKSMTGQNTNNNYNTLETSIGTDYQVPSGKTFFVTKISITPTSSDTSIGVGYGDTGVANSASPPTNAVNLTQLGHFRCDDTAAALTKEYDVFFAIPAQKFPYTQASGGTANVLFYGVEV